MREVCTYLTAFTTNSTIFCMMGDTTTEPASKGSRELLQVYPTNEGLAVYVSEPDKILTVEKVADLVGIPSGRVHSLCEKRQIPHCQPFGSQKYFLLSEILNWLKESSVPVAMY
ncbi:helix-turn-helix domain-containing protein [Fibrella aquatica]|uniref:helix-turn-helix domain-containing protein n=1 Tax=Fibrella aquatica TaxID=3242487 RepID=UPI003521A106